MRLKRKLKKGKNEKERERNKGKEEEKETEVCKNGDRVPKNEQTSFLSSCRGGTNRQNNKPQKNIHYVFLFLCFLLNKN